MPDIDDSPPAAPAPSGAQLRWSAVQSFLYAPPPAGQGEDADAASVWDTLLSWPIRLSLIVLAATVGWIWHKAPLGIQLGHVLQYGLLLAVSIVASCWLYVAIANLVVSVTWLACSWRRPAPLAKAPAHWRFTDYVSWLNHQIGNVEALATWIALVLVGSTSVLWQLVGLALVTLLGSKTIGWIAQWGWFRREKSAAEFSARMLIRRRPLT
jgi:hypothetical protein